MYLPGSLDNIKEVINQLLHVKADKRIKNGHIKNNSFLLIYALKYGKYNEK